MKLHLAILTTISLLSLTFGQNVKEIDRKAINIKSTEISEKVLEISGLEDYNDHCFMGFNDSGGEPILYFISQKSGKVKREIHISNGKNVDWEDITQDSLHIYIGDFGNNLGNRKDLTIYKIKKSDISKKKKQALEAETITFYFPEQTNFSKKNRAHNFDCESMAFYNGTLHIFTKEWNDLQVAHYTVATEGKNQAAKKIESYNLGYLATGADIQTRGNSLQLAFIGYQKLGAAFVTIFNHNLGEGEKLENFFTHTDITKLQLGLTLDIGQVEGICFKDGDIWLSSEDFKFGGFHVEQSIHHLSY